MPIIPYDEERHRHFVEAAFCAGAGEPREALARLLRQGAAKCAVRVAATDADLFYGYAVVLDVPQTVVWTYVKQRLQRSGIMTELLQHLGVDMGRQVIALFPSPACNGMIRDGWNIKYAEQGENDK